jgi:hypothetical protein
MKDTVHRRSAQRRSKHIGRTCIPKRSLKNFNENSINSLKFSANFEFGMVCKQRPTLTSSLNPFKENFRVFFFAKKG